MKIEIEEKDLREMLNELERLRQENAMRLSRAEADIRRREKFAEIAKRKADAYMDYLGQRAMWLDDVMKKLGKKADEFKRLPSYAKAEKAWEEFDAIQKEIQNEAN